MSLSELEKFLSGFELSKSEREMIIRITENRSFLREFHNTTPFGKGKLSNKNWPLYYEIMKKLKEVSEKGGARVAISSSFGLSRYHWARYWYQIPQGENAKKLFFMNNDRLRSFAKNHGIDFIEPPKNDERARNDPHLNETGHLNKAKNIYDFLMGKYGEEIRSR